MCWFYVGIAQIALDPNSVKQANVEKVPQTILANLYSYTPLIRAMPIYKQHISKRGFPEPNLSPLHLGLNK